MSAKKYFKFLRPIKSRHVLTDPDGEKFGFDTQEEMQAFLAKREKEAKKIAAAVAAATKADPPL